MNLTEYSARLRELCDAYYNQRIMFHEYRMQRKMLLDEVDHMVNGAGSSFSNEQLIMPPRENTAAAADKTLLDKMLGILNNHSGKNNTD